MMTMDALGRTVKSTIVRLMGTVTLTGRTERPVTGRPNATPVPAAPTGRPTVVQESTGPGRKKSTPVAAKAAMLTEHRYPAELHGTLTVGDARLRVRAIHPDDEPRLAALFERLSPATVYQRFFATYRRLPAAWYRELANVDYRTRLALVAEETTADGVELRGVARWEPADTPGSVEIALVVEDAWQGRGLGTALLGRLLEAARARGVRSFCADVLAENRRMLALLRRLGEIHDSTLSQGVVHLRFSLREPEAPVAVAS